MWTLIRNLLRFAWALIAKAKQPEVAVNDPEPADSETLVWLFDRTEALSNALQANFVRQAVVVGAAAAYLIDPFKLRSSVSNLLNLSGSNDCVEPCRSVLFEVAVPVLLLYSFISMGYLLGLYLGSRDDFKRELRRSSWPNFGKLPYWNGSLAGFIAALIVKEDRIWETFSGRPPLTMNNVRARLRRLPGARLVLALPYVVLFVLVISVWIGNNVFIGYFLAGPVLGSADLQTLAYVIVMGCLLPFYFQFLTSPILQLGYFPLIALPVWVTAVAIGYWWLEYPPSWLLQVGA